MAYRSNDGCVENVFGFLILFTLWFSLGDFLSSRFFENIADKWGLYYWLLYTGVLAGMIYGIGGLSILISRHHRQWKIRRTPCKHGVKGGASLGICQRCLEDKRREKIRLERERKAHERKEQIRQRAESLRDEELKRLTKLRLTKLENLLRLTPQEFEEAVGVMYKNLGFLVKQTPVSNDRGKDLILKKDNNKYLVECKRYGLDKTIGRPALQKFFAAMAEEGALKGFFVTTAQYAKTAELYARDNKIELINGEELVNLMNRAFPNTTNSEYYKAICKECGDEVVFYLYQDERQKRCRNNHLLKIDFDESTLSPKLISQNIYCDDCGKRMRVVHGRYGKFYGCTGYPQCRNTKPFEDNQRLVM